MKMSMLRIILTLVAALLALAGTLLAIWDDGTPATRAQGTIRYVAPDGDDARACDSVANRCQTVQHAVDVAASGDEVRVAQGDYTGVQGRPALGGYNGPAVITQVLYITKTVTVQGGYSNDFDTWNPTAYTTSLNAQNGGRVVFVGGNITVTLEGLHLTGGDATGLGGATSGGDLGGGISAHDVTLTLSRCQVTTNTAQLGGGVGLHASNATLNGNTIQANTASSGGGIALDGGNVTLNGNAILSNTANHSGGGFWQWGSDSALNGNIIQGNVAQSGNGGGLCVHGGNSITWDNNVIANNQAGTDGSGVSLTGGSSTLRHNTIAGQGSGSGVHVDGNAIVGYATATLTDNILVGHGVGITVTANNAAILRVTLWGSGTWDNGEDWDGNGTIDHAYDIDGDPAFVNPAAGEYHIGATSAAVDVGMNAGVTTDVDGESRPMGYGYDLGADEHTFGYVLTVNGLRVIRGVADSGTLTATLTWRPPTNAVMTYTLSYSTSLITDENWDAATVVTDTLPGSTDTYTATVPYGGDMVYFALKYWNNFGEASRVSPNAFWPAQHVYLPLVVRNLTSVESRKVIPVAH